MKYMRPILCIVVPLIWWVLLIQPLIMYYLTDDLLVVCILAGVFGFVTTGIMLSLWEEDDV